MESIIFKNTHMKKACLINKLDPILAFLYVLFFLHVDYDFPIKPNLIQMFIPSENGLLYLYCPRGEQPCQARCVVVMTNASIPFVIIRDSPVALSISLRVQIR